MSRNKMKVVAVTIIAFTMIVLLLGIPVKVPVVAASGSGVSGRVTVFANMVFTHTNWQFSNNVVIPNSLTSLTLHIKGQSNGDPNQEIVQILINNIHVWTQSYTNSFDISIGNPPWITAGNINTIAIWLQPVVGSWNVQCYFDVSTSGADVYIIKIPGYATSWVSDMDAVARGVAQSCMVKPLVHTYDWTPLTYLEINDINTYELIVSNPDLVKPSGFRGETGIIVVNVHGEVLPVPSDYTDPYGWIQVITTSIRTRGLTWAQVAGWPMYYYDYGSGAHEFGGYGYGPTGFQKFMEPVAGVGNKIRCDPGSEGAPVLLSTDYNGKLLGYGLVNYGLTEARPIDIGVSKPSDRDSWTQDVTSGDVCWQTDGYNSNPYRDTSKYTTGGASIRLDFDQQDYFAYVSLILDNGYDLTSYPVLCFDVFLNSQVTGFGLWIGDRHGNVIATQNYFLPQNQWCSVAIKPQEWSTQIFGGSLDWSKIDEIYVFPCSNGVGAGRQMWIDHLFFDSGAKNVAHTLDMMYRTPAWPVEYLTLGLVSLATPNQNIGSDSRAGYYVHNGASPGDSDYNKGKYTMAVAAWTKISLLASAETDVVLDNCVGTPPSVGKVKCLLYWTNAKPNGNQWQIDFMTVTISYVKYHETTFNFDLSDGYAPLNVWDPNYPIPSTSSPCGFDFLPSQGRAVLWKSDTSWLQVIGESTPLWTGVSVVLAVLTDGASLGATILLTLALGGLQQAMSISGHDYGNAITGPNYIDLVMKDNSNLDTTDSGGTKYRQLQSYGLSEVHIPSKNAVPSQGADYTLAFAFGQTAAYTAFAAHCSYTGLCTLTPRIIVEPSRTTQEPESPPQTTQPSGELRPFRNTAYTYSASTTDPEGDDIRYNFTWTENGVTTSTVTGWFESGNTATVTHTWTCFGQQTMCLYVQDSQEAWGPTNWHTPGSVGVNVVPKLTVIGSNGGSTNPPPGVYNSYNYLAQATVTATPNPGYYLDHWIKGTPTGPQTLPKSGNTVAFTMDNDYTIQPIFAYQCTITSCNVYYSDASQNLTTLDIGTPIDYTAKVCFTWNDAATTNTMFVWVYVYDSDSTLGWEGAVQYNGISPGSYTAYVDLVSFTPIAGTGSLQVTATRGASCAAPWTEVVNIANSNRSPNTPSFIYPVLSPYVSTSYSYSVSATDPDADYLQYSFNWGDGSPNTNVLGWYASGASATATHSWSSTGQYVITAYAKDPYGASSSKTLTINVVNRPPSGGGGCPYVYDWNGTSFAKDNNILPASETGNGTDTKDYYKLEQPLVPVSTTPQTSRYTLQIREFESEIDYIDQVRLIAVDHSQGTNIAITPEGEVLTYTTPTSPLSCIDNNDTDRLSEIATMNGNVNDASTYFQGYKDDWLILNFGKVTSSYAKLILRDDQKCCDVCINVQVLDSSGNWQTVEVLHPRDSKSDYCGPRVTGWTTWDWTLRHPPQ